MQIVHDLVSFLGMVCTQGPGRPRVSVGPGSWWAQGLSVGPALSVGPGPLGGPRLSVGPGSRWAQGL